MHYERIHYRQMAAAGFMQEEKYEDENFKRAILVAYSDVRAAFMYYLKHENEGRPIILAGHSQGSLLAEMLVDEFFHEKKLQEQLVAAYLVGWTVFKNKYSTSSHPNAVTVCKDRHHTGCVISWRTFAFGGDPTLFLHREPVEDNDRPICTNPLSWTENDGAYVGSQENLGGLDLMHPWSMLRYLVGVKRASFRTVQPTRTSNMSDAQCVDGNLYVTKPKDYGYGWYFVPAWTFAMFPGLNLHAYDYNLFFYNVRENAVERVRSFLSTTQK